jgi:hypothetical protein
MAQLGKEMRILACDGLAYNSVELVLMANGTRCEVDSDKFFLRSNNALYPFNPLLNRLNERKKKNINHL